MAIKRTTLLALNKKQLSVVKRLNCGGDGRMQMFIEDVYDDKCNDRVCFLYTVDNKILGVLLIESAPTKKYLLIDVFVSKTHRKNGIGTALLKNVCKYAKSRNLKVYGFYTDCSRRLYKKFDIKNGKNKV